MNQNFPHCLSIILGHEGEWSDHPHDPGGATMKGITLRAYRAWCKEKGKPVPSKDDLRNIPDRIVAQIYREKYWLAARCDKLPGGVDLIIFDCAVNQGVGRASRILQQAAGTTVDGIVGPYTLRAVRSKGRIGLVQEIAARRMKHYGVLKIFSTFGLGWSRRLMNVLAHSL